MFAGWARLLALCRLHPRRRPASSGHTGRTGCSGSRWSHATAGRARPARAGASARSTRVSTSTGRHSAGLARAHGQLATDLPKLPTARRSAGARLPRASSMACVELAASPKCTSHLRPRGTGRSSPELPRRPHRLQLHRAQLWAHPCGSGSLMIEWILRGSSLGGVVTTRYPRTPLAPSAFRGRGRGAAAEGAPAATADVCPTGAIVVESGRVSLDRGRCILCGACVAADPERFRFSAVYETASRRQAAWSSRKGRAGTSSSGQRSRPARGRSNGRSTSGTSTPAPTAPTSGDRRIDESVLRRTAPRHLLHGDSAPRGRPVTGGVTPPMEAPLARAYEAMPEPKAVVAAGTDACSGGLAAATANWPAASTVCCRWMSTCPARRRARSPCCTDCCSSPASSRRPTDVPAHPDCLGRVAAGTPRAGRRRRPGPALRGGAGRGLGRLLAGHAETEADRIESVEAARRYLLESLDGRPRPCRPCRRPARARGRRGRPPGRRHRRRPYTSTGSISSSMGHHRSGRVGRLLLHDLSESVVAAASMPVLIVGVGTAHRGVLPSDPCRARGRTDAARGRPSSGDVRG